MKVQNATQVFCVQDADLESFDWNLLCPSCFSSARIGRKSRLWRILAKWCLPYFLHRQHGRHLTCISKAVVFRLRPTSPWAVAM